MKQPPEITAAPTPPRKPDGVITTKVGNQTIIAELFFNHNSKQTFQDKLLRVLSAEKTA